MKILHLTMKEKDQVSSHQNTSADPPLPLQTNSDLQVAFILEV